jgi:hypothetical protein
MCPACSATAALGVAGATSVGGLTALVVTKRHAKTDARGTNPTPQTRALDKPEDGNAA